MKISIEIELGNEAMESRFDVFQAIRRNIELGRREPFRGGENGKIFDVNGNTVGSWVVSE